MRALVPLIILVAVWSNSAPAQSVRNYCASAREQLREGSPLAVAAAVVFRDAGYAARDDDCIYPLRILRYGDADVLLTLGGKPGEACHGCGGSMSAYVLERSPDRPRLVARFADFGTSGTFGDPGQIDAVTLAGHDAISVEGGGTFQGYSASRVSFFVFRNRRLEEIKPSLPLAASNGGAVQDKAAISIDGVWRIGAAKSGQVVVDYKIETGRKNRRASATWVLDGSTFKLTSGRVPPEYDEASGG